MEHRRFFPSRSQLTAPVRLRRAASTAAAAVASGLAASAKASIGAQRKTVARVALARMSGR
jgi:hypothetical protein